MDIEIRVILLVVGLLILAGVMVDVIRRKRKASHDPLEYREDLILQAEPVEPDLDLPLPELKDRDLKFFSLDADLDDHYTLDLPLDEQISDNEGSLADTIEPLYAPESAAQSIDLKPEPVISNALSITVRSREELGFAGTELLKALNSAHLYFGRNDIFYRHENEDGSGLVLFSLVKAVEPGFFYIHLLSREHVPGVTLILLPDEVLNPGSAFEQMVRTAKQLAFVLNGELLDHERQHLTLETLANYRAQIKNNANRRITSPA